MESALILRRVIMTLDMIQIELNYALKGVLLFNHIYIVAMGQGKVIFLRSGKSQGILIMVRENYDF